MEKTAEQILTPEERSRIASVAGDKWEAYKGHFVFKGGAFTGGFVEGYVYASQQCAALKEELERKEDRIESLNILYNAAQTGCELREKRLKEVEEENERLREAVRRKDFALRNCKSYLELYKEEWQEGEEILHVEIDQALNPKTENNDTRRTN